MEALLQLTDADLLELAKALRANRLDAPYSARGIERVASSPMASEIAAALQKLTQEGFSPLQLATALDLAVKARAQRSVAEDLIELVTTGPEAPGISNRDTSVVVHELFSHAQQSVLVAGYAVYQGRRVFEALADRMQEHPSLHVRFVLDIQRGPGDISTAKEITRRFAERFRTKQWPRGKRLPEVFFDARSLNADSQKKACMHAKCTVIDGATVFVSSANFTEAAQERNLEVGLLIRSARLAQRIQGHFQSLIAAGLLSPVFY
jgi:phosphatidylserine/phosphatidylglycerophosphate/cardiolipin synthase-like enzyme